jgi:lipoate-protein ligase A
MLCILNPSRDIYFNLAAEEYLLKNSDSEVIMLWQSDHSVVVGKHQNALAEVNYLWALKNNISIARRLTGGGTVYHGPGNLNFTFIRNGEPGRLVDFKRFVLPIIDFLRTLGIEAMAGERNDILVNGLKISGNAEHVFKSRVLHHGTLLFDADLNELNSSIRMNKKNYRDKAVQSVSSRVTNIRSLLKKDIPFEQFTSALFTYLMQYFSHASRYELEAHKIKSIQLLRNNKYSQEEWIFGYSPPFEFSNIARWNNYMLNIDLKIEKGNIHNISIRSDEKNVLFIRLEKHLTGCHYLLPAIERKVYQIVKNKKETEIISALFF